LHDIFVWGGLTATPKRVVPIEKYKYMYGTHPSNFRTQNITIDAMGNQQDNTATVNASKAAAKTVCDFIVNRTVETQRFQKLDKALEFFSKASFLPDLKATSGYVTKPAEELAKYIVWFCKKNNWVFNNKNTSREEMQFVCNNTIIGKVIWDNYLFAKDRIPEIDPDRIKADSEKPADTPKPVDAPKSTDAPKPQATPQPQPSQPSQPTVGANGKLPDGTKQSNANHTLYRSNANGLAHPDKPKVNQIGVNGKVYKIVGIKENVPTKITLNVKPRHAATPLNVNYGVGTGWNDCMLFFGSDILANDFRDKAWAGKPSDITELTVVSTREDTNGYVEVITEFGNAYIVASKLHEEVEEELKEDKNENIPYKSKISNREVVKEFFKDFFDTNSHD